MTRTDNWQRVTYTADLDGHLVADSYMLRKDESLRKMAQRIFKSFRIRYPDSQLADVTIHINYKMKLL